MRPLETGLLAVAVVALGLSAGAQEKPGVAMEVISAKAKPGLDVKYEEGRKKHAAWHRAQADTWTWTTWQIETGSNSGGYYVTTPGHHWKDFDAWQQKLGKADQTDWQLNVGPYAAEEASSYWVAMPELSRPLDAAAPPPAQGELTTFRVKASGAEAFNDALTPINEAFTKTNAPLHYYIYALWDGGFHPTFALFIPMKGTADWEGMIAVPTVLTQAYGDKESARVMGLLGGSVESQYSELLRYREDLSYSPPK